jgi:cysteine-rich repeat protein
LIDNAIRFAASGVSSTGQPLTGLYFALSCYYQDVDSATVDALSYFGDFEVRGNLDCYNNAHIVASSPALGTLTDGALSDWSCSVHEAFSVYPSVGVNGFQALVIAKDIIGTGSQTFGDGTVGLPYIISRGATPAGCGNGIWEKAFGEECDDGKKNGAPGDACSISCKCLSGRPAGDGTCLPALVSSSSSSSMPPVSTPYGNYSTKVVTTTDTIVSTT